MKYIFCGVELFDAAAVHDHDSITHLIDNAEIMRNE
jgi:hypothetical protein